MNEAIQTPDIYLVYQWLGEIKLYTFQYDITENPLVLIMMLSNGGSQVFLVKPTPVSYFTILDTIGGGLMQSIK
jgi:hypothetical protein